MSIWVDFHFKQQIHTPPVCVPKFHVNGMSLILQKNRFLQILQPNVQTHMTHLNTKSTKHQSEIFFLWFELN